MSSELIATIEQVSREKGIDPEEIVHVVTYEGKISSLKRFKDDASEVKEGFECGVGIENYNDIKVGDTIEAYTTEKVARQLQ